MGPQSPLLSCTEPLGPSSRLPLCPCGAGPLQGGQSWVSRSRAARSCQAGEVAMVSAPSSLALAGFLRAQTGLTGSSVLETLISRKAKLLDSRRKEAWAEQGLSGILLLLCVGPSPAPALPQPLLTDLALVI